MVMKSLSIPNPNYSIFLLLICKDKFLMNIFWQQSHLSAQWYTIDIASKKNKIQYIDSILKARSLYATLHGMVAHSVKGHFELNEKVIADLIWDLMLLLTV